MKKLIAAFLTLTCLWCSSCSEDFQVTAPYKDITFVYSFLSMQDNAHYIRIQKAFLDENKSAVEMAKEADSNYYQNLEVTVREISGKNILNNFPLQKVDMAQEGLPKDTGSFFDNPSYAYKFTHKLDPQYNYRLVIFNPQNGYSDSSEIKIVDTTKLYLSLSSNSKFKFDKTIPANTSKYNLVILNNPGSNIKYMEGFIRFFWDDKNIVSGDVIRKSADFLLDSRPTGSSSQEVMTTSNQSFYYFLKSVMGDAPDNHERYLDSCDFYVYAGGVDYYNYRLAKTFHSGLTADQSQPIFTNIIGKDIYGLFSTKAVAFKLQVPIDTATMDSLMLNSITNPLRIKGTANH